MTDQPVTPTQEAAAIHDIARHARRLRLCVRRLYWTMMPFVLMIGYITLFSLVDHRPASTIGLFLAIFAAVPMFSMFVWMIVEQQRAGKSCTTFTELLTSRQEEIKGNLSPSEIGPLLEVTMTGAINGNFIEVPAALLGSLLSTCRAEDEIVLTQEQRGLLHELVIHHLRISDGAGMIESTRRKVRPAAISALALLGNRSSLPVLERFARKTDNPALRQAALHSADQIRERMPYDPKQMLRAANAPERTETLLRAATADKSTDNSSQQLLRANLSENPSEPEQ